MDDKHGKIVPPHQRKNNRELIPHQGQTGCREADDRKLRVHFFSKEIKDIAVFLPLPWNVLTAKGSQCSRQIYHWTKQLDTNLVV